MQLLEARELTFFSDADGSLCVAIKGGLTYRGIRCSALFPISEPTGHISLQLPAPAQSLQEIGILRNLTGLPPAQQRLVAQDLRQRYFVPEILDILRISKGGGGEHWSVLTDCGERLFTLIDKHENITMTDKGVVFITDAERLRYKISRPASLPARARGLLDKVLL